MHKQFGISCDRLFEGIHDEESFSLIFKDWYPAICYFVFSILKNIPEAEDIAEESFIKLWDRRESFTSLQHCKSFLYACARNASFTILAHRKIIESSENEMSYLFDKNGSDPLKDVIFSETVARLHNAIENLPPACAKVMKLMYQDGMNSREIAKILNLSVSTVKTQKLRAISILRKRLVISLLLLSPLFF